MCNFRVGQKVVCVEMESLYPPGVVPLEQPIQPVVGSVYTVREIVTGKVGGVPCLKLHEIPDHLIKLKLNGELLLGDVVYDAVGFRPVVERKTDISVFRAMLNTTPETVGAA